MRRRIAFGTGRLESLALMALSMLRIVLCGGGIVVHGCVGRGSLPRPRPLNPARHLPSSEEPPHHLLRGRIAAFEPGGVTASNSITLTHSCRSLRRTRQTKTQDPRPKTQDPRPRTSTTFQHASRTRAKRFRAIPFKVINI